MELLNKLTNINAPSGNETAITSYIKETINNYVDELYIDALGNLIAHKKGEGKKLMLSANVDEVGFITLVLGDYVSVGKIGAVNIKTLHTVKVIFSNNQYGIITDTTGESIDNSTNISNFKINLFNNCKVDKLNIGDTATFVPNFVDFNDEVCSKALSSRACCYSLINVIKNLKDFNYDLYFVFAVQGKIGSRGLKTAANAINPDYAIHLTATVCNDNTGIKSDIKDGNGAVLRLMDTASICNKAVKDIVISAAKSVDCNLQYEITNELRSECTAVDTVSSGVIAGTIGIPCRYINSANEVMNKQDIFDSIKILTEICKGGK